MTPNTLPETDSNRNYNAPDESPTQEVSFARAEQLLTKGEIAHIQGTTLWGSNYSALVHIRDEELESIAIYKPQRGERPLWDFPNGTLCFREVAAYHVSQALGWGLVPPTVLRDGPQGVGSLQLFVAHDPEINYFNLDNRFAAQLKYFALFDFLVNNADRKGGHLLLSPQGKLWGIDHGLTFHAMPKLRTVIWEFAGQPIEDDLLPVLETLCQKLDTPTSELRTRLAPLLCEEELSAMILRVQHILDSKTYPLPGPGPNHPWPPV